VYYFMHPAKPFNSSSTKVDPIYRFEGQNSPGNVTKLILFVHNHEGIYILDLSSDSDDDIC